MEITEYVDFIKEQFKDIAKDYGFSWRQQNAGILFLEKKNVSIEFSAIYREDGIIIIVKSPSGKSYDALDLIEKKKILNNSYLTEEDKQKCKSFNDQIKIGVYVFYLILSKYCQDILNGDFSSVGKR